MRYFEKFQFGRYKGRTLISVFTGDLNFSKELIESTILSFYKDFRINDKFIEFFDTGPDEKILDSLNGSIFRFGNAVKSRINSGLIGDQFKSESEKLLIKENYADPDYISWCINEIEDFFLIEKDIELLEKVEVFNIKGIEVQTIIDNIYKWNPYYCKSFYKFSDSIKEKNDIKRQ